MPQNKVNSTNTSSLHASTKDTPSPPDLDPAEDNSLPAMGSEEILKNSTYLRPNYQCLSSEKFTHMSAKGQKISSNIQSQPWSNSSPEKSKSLIVQPLTQLEDYRTVEEEEDSLDGNFVEAEDSQISQDAENYNSMAMDEPTNSKMCSGNGRWKDSSVGERHCVHNQYPGSIPSLEP